MSAPNRWASKSLICCVCKKWGKEAEASTLLNIFLGPSGPGLQHTCRVCVTVPVPFIFCSKCPYCAISVGSRCDPGRYIKITCKRYTNYISLVCCKVRLDRLTWPDEHGLFVCSLSSSSSCKRQPSEVLFLELFWHWNFLFQSYIA